MNGAFILSQLWLIIAVRSTDDYDERDLAIIPEVDFLSVSQETSSTSFPLNNLTQRPHQQHDENHSLEERNHRFQAYQERKVDKESDDIEDSVTEPLARFSVVTLVQMDVNNDTRLISPANSSNLQNIAFPVLPNNEENGKRMLSNNTEASEQDKNDNKKDEEDNGLNSNAIDEELEIRRKMKRTTIEVRSYPPVTETSSSPATTNIPSLDLDHTTALPATAISLPSTPDYSSISHDLDFGPRTTVSYASLSSTLPSNVAQDHYNRFSEVIKRVNVTELSTVPSFINVAVPFALPIPLGKAETPINLFDTQLQNSGFGALINNGHFWTADRLDAARKNDALQLQEKIQGQMQLHAPVDDVLGCTWDIVTSSCKDLFSLKLCSHCHDFGNIFLHNCKCLVKY
ncbi:unnamed protein product [Onchocerca ochengi]|uniref:Secreted protein n=1 Tax=Onchocerca ochengi TaxID=42157 RepID=A0A182E381_ONCOC|nr:unnamed protein product [Onchocerca ochengi]